MNSIRYWDRIPTITEGGLSCPRCVVSRRTDTDCNFLSFASSFLLSVNHPSSTMGQLLSYLFSLRPVAPSLSPPPLLCLPGEIKLLIGSKLSTSPESIIALALTCKPLYRTLEKYVTELKLSNESRKALLILLEKDLGDRFFFCFVCCELHRFWSSWDPISLGSCFNSCHSHASNRRSLFNPDHRYGGSRYNLYVHPFHLVAIRNT